MASTSVQCHICKSEFKGFSRKSCLLQHMRCTHTVQTKLYERSFHCEDCGRGFDTHRGLDLHVQRKHSDIHEVSTSKKVHIKCLNCSKMIEGSAGSLRNHVEQEHQTNIEQESLTFKSMQEFQVWKAAVEENTRSHYVKQRGAVLVAGNKKYYLQCHRSGYYTSQATGKRRYKSQTSNKLEGTCTSSMTVNESSSGNVKVKFWKTHIGHTNCLSSTTKKRAGIADTALQNHTKPTSAQDHIYSIQKQTTDLLQPFAKKLEIFSAYLRNAILSDKDRMNIEKKLDALVACAKKLPQRNGDDVDSIVTKTIEPAKKRAETQISVLAANGSNSAEGKCRRKRSRKAPQGGNLGEFEKIL